MKSFFATIGILAVILVIVIWQYGFFDKQVKDDNKEFTVQVSIGACVRRPTSDDIGNIKELSEEYMKIADTAMYEQKKAHKAQKNAD